MYTSIPDLRPFGGAPDIFLTDKSASSAIDPGTHLCPALSSAASTQARGHSVGAHFYTSDCLL